MPGTPTATKKPKPRRRHLYRLLVFLLLVGLVPKLAFDVVKLSPIADYPLVFVLGIWSACLLGWGFVQARRKQGGALAFNLGFLCLAVAAVELWIGQSGGIAKHMVHAPPREEYVAPHPDLGYAPRPGKASRFAAVSEGDEVYDATYTIGEDGLRVRPPLHEPPPQGGVLCFGCSFTFGSGLADDQTIPWQLEERLGGRLRCYNFGFSGYGPHQMLANLQSGRAESLVQYPVRHVLYLAIPDHARRVAGAAVHDRRGPRYVLTADGDVRHEGTFSDRIRSVWRRRIFQFLNHSHLGQAITLRLSRNEGSVELFAAVVEASREAAQARWPESTFRVILWDDRPAQSKPVLEALARRGIDAMLVSGMLPGFAENAQRYRLHRADEHPSAGAAAAIARVLADEILATPTGAPR